MQSALFNVQLITISSNNYMLRSNNYMLIMQAVLQESLANTALTWQMCSSRHGSSEVGCMLTSVHFSRLY